MELIESYPQECRFVIETLAEVYKYDEEANVEKMTPSERLCFHQEKSKPLMDKLEKWLEECSPEQFGKIRIAVIF